MTVEMVRCSAYTQDSRRIRLAASFGEWVREKRLEKGLLVKTLAARLEMIPQNLSRIESGQSVSRDMAERIAAALEMDAIEALAIWAKGGKSETIRYVTDPDTAAIVENYEGIVTPANRELVRSVIQQIRESERRHSIGGRKDDADADSSSEDHSTN